MNATEGLLRELMEWGGTLPGFTETYARDGLRSAQLFAGDTPSAKGLRLPSEVLGSDRSLLLLAMDSAWISWLDARFDARTDPPARSGDSGDSGDSGNNGKLTDLAALIRAATEAPSTPEGESFFRLRSRMAEESRDGETAAYTLWLATAVDMFQSWHEDESLSRGERQWTYTEYVHNGERSIAVLHFMATVSLVFRLDMHRRMTDERFCRMLRNLSLAGRLVNDLAGVEKDRAAGERANAVLLLEEFLSPERARDFVAAQREGYKRLLFRDLESLGTEDVFAGLARMTLHTIERYYEKYYSGS
jgi:hypothetical protein